MAEAGAAEAADGSAKSAYATGADWQEVARGILAAIDPPPQGANFGLLYVNPSLAGDIGSLVTLLRQRSGIDDWCGTVGAGVVAPALELYDQPAASLLLIALPPDGFRLVPSFGGEGDPAPRDLVDWAESHRPLVGLIHADPRTLGLPELTTRFAADHDLFLVGGLSAGAAEQPQIAGRAASGTRGPLGLSGIVFDHQVPILSGLTQGCTPIGPPRQVTAGEAQFIREIDGRPALDVLKEDVGELLARNLSRIGGYIFAAFPIPGSDTADYLVRNIVAVDSERGWLAVADAVEPGRRIVFVRRDHEGARHDLTRMLEDLCQRAGRLPRAAVYVACVARGRHLFGPDSEEMKQVSAALGPVPITGFFANGEISNNRIYGYTGVLTLFL